MYDSGLNPIKNNNLSDYMGDMDKTEIKTELDSYMGAAKRELGSVPVERGEPGNAPIGRKLGNVSVVRNEPKKKKVAVEESILTEVPVKSEGRKGKLSPYELYKILKCNNTFIRVNGRVHVYIEKYGYYADVLKVDGTLHIRMLFEEKYRPYINKSVLAEIVEWLKTDTPDIGVDELEKGWDFINFRNGVYSLKSSKLYEHSAQYYFLSYVNADVPDSEILSYNRKVSYFEKYLDDTFRGYKKNRLLFEEVLGVAISPIRNIKKSIFFYGASNSGKSVALNVLSNIVGEEFTSSVSFSQLGEEFAVAILPGKTLNVSGETSGIGNKRFDIYKSITGNDKVTACLKGQDYFQFVNTALLVFACNELPAIKDEMLEPLIERMQIIKFPNVVNDENRNINLLSRFEDEKATIIKIAIKGLKRFIANNYKFSDEGDAREILNDYIEGNNNFILFAQEYIQRDKKGVVASSEIAKAYSDYCMKKEYVPVHSNQWAKILKNTSGAISVRITDNEFITYNARGYKGITLNYELSNQESGWEDTEE